MPDYSSSSDDEDAFRRPNVTLPALNPGPKRQPQPNAKRNFAKAGQVLKSGAQGKSVRFPQKSASHQQQHLHRLSMLSNTSRQDSSDSDSAPDGASGASGGADPNLPSFRMQAPLPPAGAAHPDSDSDGSDGSDIDPATLPRYVQEYSSDDDDDNDDDDDETPEAARVARQASRASAASAASPTGGSGAATAPAAPPPRRTSLTSSFRRPSTQHSAGTDITEQREDAASAHSANSDERGGLKGILRKMSLVSSRSSHDGDYPEGVSPASASDTFLGKVLSFSNAGSGGLSGGGLVPGASKQESRLKDIDEEGEVGMEDDDPNAMELKRMDFAKLSQEAQNLISSHVPDAHLMMEQVEREAEREAERRDDGSTSASLLEEKSNESAAAKASAAARAAKAASDAASDAGSIRSTPAPPVDVEVPSADQFQQPNPDLFLRSEGQHDDDDYLMLDDSGGDGYVAPPKTVHAGVLSSLLKLYQNPQEAKSASTFYSHTLAEEQDEDVYGSPPGKDSKLLSGFRKTKGAAKSVGKFGRKRGGAAGGGADADEKELDSSESEGAQALPSFQNAKPRVPRGTPKVPNFGKKLKKNKLNEQLRITVHIADILQRQRFVLRMCKALMLYGAPTHRLEEYMTMTSRVLEIDGQFIYFPGCMIVAFGDAATRTSEVHLVRCAQGLNLSKLSDTHRIYKSVIHDLSGVEEAAVKLEELLKKRNLYNPWICVFLYGLGSSMVAPFAFGGGWYDIPICFVVGLCVGYLQFFLSSKSNLYSSVFEVTASIVVSFIARGIGSIKGGKWFCFAAVAQGSLALILPGYIILCGSLELQSRNIVAGSVRMFYAIIYSLFLGFGITLGAALYGWVDKDSTSNSKCPKGHNMDPKFRILFVPMYSMCLGLINQARFRQLPVMVIIASVGYIANYFAGKHFSQVTEFTAAIGAFVVGVLSNMYSRIGKGLAVSAMLPAIFVQVPSGIASQSTLLTGIANANSITKNNATTDTTAPSSNASGSLSFGATMVEVSIGISVGLFAAALVVYPFGKKRTGLFTL
ncbi:Pheromone-regulated membrane protein 10 [[Candida] zeylanoides]